MKKKLLAILTATLLIVTLIPMFAFPAFADDPEPTTDWGKLAVAIAGLTIESNDAFTVSDEASTKTRTIVLKKDITYESGAEILNQGYWNIVLDLNGYVLNRGLIGDNGTITNNEFGCVIYATSPGYTFTIEDGNNSTVHKFKILDSGLWVLDEENGTIVVNGGVITGGTGCYYNKMYIGGAIFAENSNIIMNGGNIIGNQSYIAGGIYSGRDLTIKNGAIRGNVAEYGAGVWSNLMPKSSEEAYKFTMNGGEITDNIAIGSVGGVYSGGNMYVSGKVIIKDNQAPEGKIQNLAAGGYDFTGTTPVIYISDALTGSEIYVTHSNNCGENNTGILTSGYLTKNPGAGLNDFFHYDGTKYAELNEDNEIEVVNEEAFYVNIDQTITNGIVKASFNRAKEGDKVILTVTADEGYELDTLTVKDADGKEVTVKDKAFSMPAKDVTVKATFKTVSKPDVPKTGDENNMILWIVLALAAAGLAVGTVLVKRTDR